MKNDYLYEISVYQIKDIYNGRFGIPDIVGIFSEDNLELAQSIVANSVTDLYEGCFEIAMIDKVPCNSLYPNAHIKERYIYRYFGNDTYKLLSVAKGLDQIVDVTEKLAKTLEKKEKL